MIHVVLRRLDAVGWVVGQKETDPLRQEAAERLRGFPFLWEVETIIADANWDGPVWVGGEVSPAEPKDGRPMFKCELSTGPQNS